MSLATLEAAARGAAHGLARAVALGSGEQPTLTLKETAAYFGVDRGRVREWAAAGVFPHAYRDDADPKRNRPWRIPAIDVIAARPRPAVPVREPTRTPAEGARAVIQRRLTGRIRHLGSGPEPHATEAAVEAAAAALRLIEIDPHDEDSWQLVGLARGYGILDDARWGSLAPPHPHLIASTLAGEITALVEQDMVQQLGALASRHHSTLPRVLARPDSAHLIAPVLRAILPSTPARLASVLDAVPAAFPGRDEFLAELHRRAAALVRTEDRRADALIDAARHAIVRWLQTSRTRPGSLLAMQARLRLLRARAARCRGDFPIARRHLDAITFRRLPDDERGEAATERALIGAHLSDPSDLHFPRSDHEQRALAGRLARVEPHLIAACRATPADPIVHLLAGLLAHCRDDPGRAVHHLAVVDRIPETLGSAELAAGVRYHRAAAQLRLEPDLAPVAAAAMQNAVDWGYTPPPADSITDPTPPASRHTAHSREPRRGSCPGGAVARDPCAALETLARELHAQGWTTITRVELPPPRTSPIARPYTRTDHLWATRGTFGLHISYHLAVGLAAGSPQRWRLEGAILVKCIGGTPDSSWALGPGSNPRVAFFNTRGKIRRAARQENQTLAATFLKRTLQLGRGGVA